MSSARADIAINFVESAPKDRFVIKNDGECNYENLIVEIDLTDSAGRGVSKLCDSCYSRQRIEPRQGGSGSRLRCGSVLATSMVDKKKPWNSLPPMVKCRIGNRNFLYFESPQERVEHIFWFEKSLRVEKGDRVERKVWGRRINRTYTGWLIAFGCCTLVRWVGYSERETSNCCLYLTEQQQHNTTLYNKKSIPHTQVLYTPAWRKIKVRRYQSFPVLLESIKILLRSTYSKTMPKVRVAVLFPSALLNWLGWTIVRVGYQFQQE